MSSDPLYEEIVAALAKPGIDGNLFESCIVRLLRPEIPGLVPNPGPGDSGADGAFLDAQGRQGLLVCTTDENVIGNLSESLKSHLRSGRTWRTVAIATSQALTPTRRRNLEDRAREKGFTCLAIYDRPALADRLYHAGELRMELLGIAGAPSALSIVPRSRRRIAPDREPIGRSLDAAWIQETTTDSLLSGQPGAGKTFLLHHLLKARAWNALFLDVSADAGQIADALRKLRPAVVIVDDAHVSLAALERLIALRTEISARFSILATTWPAHHRDKVLETFGGLAREHVLEPLTRREILAVFEQEGVRGSDDLLRELIDQAGNRPGLAATLARLVLAGKDEEVFDGRALQRTLLHGFGVDLQPLLAALGLGGDRGMRLSEVSRQLGVSLADSWQSALDLSSAGVLTVLGDDYLSVWPRILRWRLVAQVFFGRPSLPYEGFLESAPSRAELLLTLLYAKSRCGANIASERLHELVAGMQEEKVWKVLVQLDDLEARWGLCHYPGNPLDIAREALVENPLCALMSILMAAKATAANRGRPDPWEILSTWARGILPDPQDEVRRRVQLGMFGKSFLDLDRAVGQRAIFLSLDPERKGTSLDPAVGDTLRIRWALLPEAQIRLLAAFWDEMKAAVSIVEEDAWEQVEQTLWSWIRPERIAKQIPSALGELMRSTAGDILSHLAAFTAAQPGRGMRLRRLARACGVELAIERDEVFELLFPSLDALEQPYGVEVEARQERLLGLARSWKDGDPGEIASRLRSYQLEGARSGPGANLLGHLARHLAQEVAEPEIWFAACCEQDLFAVAAAFSSRIVADRRTGWSSHLDACAAHPGLRFFAAEEILGLEAPSPLLLSAALDVAAQHPRLVEDLALRRRIPLDTLHLLLRDSQWELALAAAIGEWNAGASGTARVRDEVFADWRTAMLAARCSGPQENHGHDYWLQMILESDSELAFDWLQRRLAEPDTALPWRSDSLYAAAVKALAPPRKQEMLATVTVTPITGHLVRPLVGEDPALYRLLLTRRELAAHHLEPLAGLPTHGWTELARIALDAGYTSDQVAHAAFRVEDGSFGRHSFQAWNPGFEALSRHPDEGIRAVAARGLASLRDWEVHAAEDRRLEELHGLGFKNV